MPLGTTHTGLKHPARWLKRLVVSTLVAAAGAVGAQTGSPYVQTNLVSNLPGLATITDPLLVNPWGISRSPTSPFWLSNQGTNTSTLYSVTGSTTVAKVNIAPNGFVAIPTTGGGPQGPTGQVNNVNTSSFQLTPGDASTSSRFIFADLNGTISGWAGGPSATIRATTPGAVYTGLAINRAGTRLYAADTVSGGIQVFDASFARLTAPGAFVDPTLPAGFGAFNVEDIGGTVYVAYAPAGLAAQRSATAGMGFVSAFDENGSFLRRVVSGDRLAAPWGLALAPASFGPFGGDLLVGNFSFVASEINAFDPLTGALKGTIPIAVGAGNTPGGLWGLSFGNGGSGGSPGTLYVANGINGETAGLFAALAPIPEPSTVALMTIGLLLMGGLRRVRSAPGTRHIVAA
jgi:uncharacterized protein (TIGR03118 family)